VSCVVGVDCGSDDSEVSRSVHRDLWTALKTRKEAIEAELNAKIAKLKELCLKEAVCTSIDLFDIFSCHVRSAIMSYLMCYMSAIRLYLTSYRSAIMFYLTGNRSALYYIRLVIGLP
jgi:Cytohesin Ubiquitin Protein Inducing Domain